jgi:UrcA family protein
MNIRAFNGISLFALVLVGSGMATMTQAAEHIIVVSKAISSAGLDLRHPTDAQAFYEQLRRGADFVCRGGMRVDVPPSSNTDACFEKSLGKAVREAHATLVTEAYLSTHTLRDAAMWGISIPSAVASR